MNHVTLKSLAKDLGLSTSTVSKALSDSYEISSETKKRVLAHAKDKQYKPNQFAKNLRTGGTNTIGIIISSISNTFMAQIVQGIQEVAQKYEYDFIIMQSQEDADIEKKSLENLFAKGVNGILLSPVHETSNIALLEQMQEEGCPIVLFDRIDSSLNTHKVGVNNFMGSYEATQLLINSGHRRFLHIGAKGVGISKDRFNGFKKALDDADIPFSNDQYLQCTIGDIETMRKEIHEVFSKIKNKSLEIDAIFGGSDIISANCLGILAELDIKVPNEVSVIGFSNSDLAFALNPSLSTITQPAEEIGRLAVEKLEKILSKKRYAHIEFETVELDTTIVLRNSTRK
ncbi:LacI family DNA-binding transcriptional regulator [Sphingobacteriaceae bacterium WQ 2009]|uniref:LacI family DNA-binding transcriptional regulator n=1 Tax=Rhinopithecimicrobium faecis TaxID=2820698 RepID=A0A8T4HGY4_9SPHI|nr:LacI family DNA-binding transcriptional regulator [Sphingobacteriaceae bacterium WQ 2009]